MVEHIEVARFDLVQDGMIQTCSGQDREPAISMEKSDSGHCLAVQSAGALNLEAHECPP
jgi:hypothetical protein